MTISESIPSRVGESLHVRHSVLITVPRLELAGGVSNYYRVLRRYFRSDRWLGKEFFEVGAKPGESASKRLFRDYWRFHRRLSEGDVHLVHLNPSLNRRAVIRDGIFLLIARLHSVRVVVLYHGWSDKFRERVQRWYFAWLFRWVSNKAEAIIVLATEFRQQLQGMGITVPIDVGTTCVDDAEFQHRADHSDTRLNILYLSRLVPGKGLDLAIQAFERLDNATLTIAGDGPSRAEQEKLVKALGIENVRFIGHVEGEAKRRAYTEANVFFFPTLLDEGMPTTVVEAMAYGLPVVTRSVGGLKDFFNEHMGFITESRSDCMLAAMLRDLTPEVRKRMGDYNRRYAREHFSGSKVAQGFESIYFHALNEGEVHALTL